MGEKLNDIELRSEEVKDILSKVPHWIIRWGSLLFFSLLILVLVLSWFIKYPDTIATEAVLTTKIPPQKEYARITGKIDTLYVKDKEQVTKNKVLAILENTANYKDMYRLKSVMDTLKMNRENVFFPFDKLPILFLGDVESNFSQFENNYFQYKLNNELQPFSNEALANKISLKELRRRLQNLNTQYKISENELEFKKKNLERNTILFEKGIISTQEYENKQLEFLTAQKNYQSMSITISQLREAISNANNASKGTNYNKNREEVRLLKSTLQSYNQLKNAIKEWELKYVLKSRIDGHVSFFNFWNKNQTVTTGDLVFSILPSTKSPYVVKLKTPSANAGKIRIGQNVNISLFDYPEYEFGVLKGRVTKISTTSDKEGLYIVDVSISGDLITSYGKQLEFKQEMKGNADIITEDLRLLERLFYQFRNVFKRS